MGDLPGGSTVGMAYENIVPTGRDNGDRMMAGSRGRAKVEVVHETCGHTWWTMDRMIIERVRRATLEEGDDE